MYEEEEFLRRDGDSRISILPAVAIGLGLAAIAGKKYYYSYPYYPYNPYSYPYYGNYPYYYY